MKKLVFITFFSILSFTSYSQYRWELTGGLTSSKLNLDNVKTEGGTGFFFNAGYGYVMGYRAKTSIVFSLDLLQRKSKIIKDDTGVFSDNSEIKALQVGFTPKLRYLFGSGKDKLRGFVQIGPSFRVNTSFEIGDKKLKSGDQFEQVIIGGVYGGGISYMLGEMFDVMAEAGVMNDFVDNIVKTKSKFFDIYARIGIRIRIYDTRR